MYDREKKTILIVDDNKVYLESFVNQLRKELPDFDFVPMSDPFRAMIYTRENPTDLIIMDMLLDRFDGIQILRAIRRFGCQAPAVIMSGYGEFEITKRLFPENNVKKVITKTAPLCSIVGLILNCFKNETAREPQGAFA